MPVATITLPNVEESVSRPLIADLTEQVKKLVNLKHVDDVRYMNYNGMVQNPDTAIGDERDRYATFAGKTRLFVEAEEDFNADGWASTVVERIEHLPLVADPALDLWITPVLVACDLTLKFKFQTRSRDEARRWRDDIVMRLAQLREGTQHTLTFNINLPNSVWNLVGNIWRCRERIKGYGETFIEYVRRHSDRDLTVVSNAAGKIETLAFVRRLGQVNGRFVVSPLPEKPTFEESGGVWECSLEYKITYDRPIGCSIRYPIQVHQQFLEDKYILPDVVAPSPNETPRKHSQSQEAFHQFTTYNINGCFSHQDAYAKIPAFDEYVMKTRPRGTATVLLALLQLETEDPQVLFNLSDLGDIIIEPDILEFIKYVEHPYLTQPYASFFQIQVYRNDDLMDSKDFEVDSNLNVKSKLPLDLRNAYRVRFSIVVDPSMVPPSAFERMYSWPQVIVKLVSSINEALRYNTDFHDLMKLRPLNTWEFGKLWHMLIGMRPGSDNPYVTEALRGSSGGTRGVVFPNLDRYKDLDPKTGRPYNEDEDKNPVPWDERTDRHLDESKHIHLAKNLHSSQKAKEIFAIPDWAYERAKRGRGFGMRTVAINGYILRERNKG